MSKKKNNIIPMGFKKERMQKVEKHVLPKIRVDDMSVKSIGKEGMDFIKFGEVNHVDFNAFFVMFSVWMSIPQKDKEAVIVQLVKDGKVNVDKDVRKDSKGE